MDIARPAGVPIAVAFAAPILAGFAGVGLVFHEWGYLLVAALEMPIAVGLLRGLAAPLSGPKSRSRLMGVGSVSLLLGAMMTPLLLAMGFEYDRGPGRTNWIELWAFGASLPAYLSALVLVGTGFVIMRHRDRAATVRAQRVLVFGAALGAATMLLLQLALAFDLAGLYT
jgi:hypothetical protein